MLASNCICAGNEVNFTEDQEETINSHSRKNNGAFYLVMLGKGSRTYSKSLTREGRGIRKRERERVKIKLDQAMFIFLLNEDRL